MSKVFKLGIAKANNKKINEVSSIDVLANKGVVVIDILKILMILIVSYH